MATTPTIDAGPRLPQWLLPLLLGFALVGVLVAVVVLARRASEPDAPPEPPTFTVPAPASPVVVFDVEAADGGRLRVSGGDSTGRQSGVDLVLDPSATVDLVEPVAAADLKAGDWLTVAGIPNEVKNFSIRALVVLPGPGAPGADGIARSPGGFSGGEASRDGRERPVFGGVIERVEGGTVVLKTAAGQVTVTTTALAPLRRLRTATAQEIHAGDRIALWATRDGQPDTGRGVLVLVGGAR
jgi:hypothetical protein